MEQQPPLRRRAPSSGDVALLFVVCLSTQQTTNLVDLFLPLMTGKVSGFRSPASRSREGGGESGALRGKANKAASCE